MKKLLILLFSLFTFVVKGQVNAVGIPFGMDYDRSVELLRLKYGKPDVIFDNSSEIFYDLFRLDGITYNYALFDFDDGIFKQLICSLDNKYPISKDGIQQAYTEAQNVVNVLKNNFTTFNLIELNLNEFHVDDLYNVGFMKLFTCFSKDHTYKIDVILFVDDCYSIRVIYSQGN